jgi:hypothetical protein
VEEVQRIHDEESREGEPDVFGLRNAAASRIYSQLSDDEKAKIEQQTRGAGEVSNPPDIQRK